MLRFSKVRTTAALLLALPFATAQDQAQLHRTPEPDRAPPPLQLEPATPFSPRDIAAAPFDRVDFDSPGDGRLWAHGAAYKASFDEHGASVIPFFGSHAPQNFPVEFRASACARGGEPFELEERGVTRNGDTVRIDRGAFVEEYELALDSLEQRFVFNELPGDGDLVLRIDLATELAARDNGATLSFENAYGRVDYSEAFAFDADGARLALDSQLVDGALELRVPEEFAANAQLPLVIDPFVTFFTVSTSSPSDDFLCDVAYDASSARWGVSFVRVFSASDYDVYVRLVSATGVLESTITVDFTSVLWTTPAIANNNSTNRFLVVAAAVPTGQPADIRGRLVDPVSSDVGGAQFFVSPQDGAYRNMPDVGGDPYMGVSNYCVVWQRPVSASAVSIESTVVSRDGVATPGFVTLDGPTTWNERPRISNGLGIDDGGNTAAWNVVWQRRFNPSDYDIYGARVRWTGAIVTPVFPIETSILDERNPSVSTVSDPTVLGVERPYVVVYERNFGDRDLMARVCRGAIVGAPTNLVGQFPSTSWYRDQLNPSIDCDGEQFFLGFDERDVGGQPDVWTCTYYVSGDSLYPCELRRNFAGSPAVEGECKVYAQAASGGAKQRYFGAWVYLSLNNGYDVQGGLWNGCSGGMVESFCAGDGSGVACPCSNTGAAGRGCRNSANGNGALLSGLGDASVGADTFKLNVVGMPLNSSCLLFQGTTAGVATPFGDGLRCVNGFTLRLPLLSVNGGAANYPALGQTPISAFNQALQPGDVRYYQAWYRDSASFCTASTFNLSNALKVTWAP